MPRRAVSRRAKRVAIGSMAVCALLLFLTAHGNRDRTLALHMPERFDAVLTPAQLRAALDAAGVRNRLVIVSACFAARSTSAGTGAFEMFLSFAPALSTSRLACVRFS